MSLLDDPALNLRRPAQPSAAPVRDRIRFRPSSTFADSFCLPPRTTGTITGTYDQGGTTRAWVTIDLPGGPMYATGVRVDEVERI